MSAAFAYRPTEPASLSAEPAMLQTGEAREFDFRELRAQFATEHEWLAFLERLKEQRMALSSKG